MKKLKKKTIERIAMTVFLLFGIISFLFLIWLIKILIVGIFT